jgi:Tfp pilus assembly protein PilF
MLKKAVAKAPNALDIHWHLAAAYDKAGDLANARANLELLLSKGRDFASKQEAMALFNKLKQGAK